MKKEMLPTALVGEMTSKTDERIAFFGTADELSCYLMELKCYLNNQELNIIIIKIVKKLSYIMGEVAGSANCKMSETDLNELIDYITIYKKSPTRLDHFVLPGNNLTSAKIHIVRTVARRCELAYARVYDKYGGNDYLFEYLNKLSTFLYELALTYETNNI